MKLNYIQRELIIKSKSNLHLTKRFSNIIEDNIGKDKIIFHFYKNEFMNKIKVFYETNNNILKLIYQNDKDKIETKILGKQFVQISKNKGIIIIKNKKKKLEEKLKTNQKEKYISVKLKLLENIMDLNSMFKGCTTLYSVSHTSKLNSINAIKFGKNKNLQNIDFKYFDISDGDGCSLDVMN